MVEVVFRKGPTTWGLEFIVEDTCGDLISLIQLTP
jgi:hypothetical protein|tara:strand:- start:341 stop:445 length:105 start_codon:yes stop_codon:yes gene_type:complete